ncbi:hypothetical protein O988_04250 [Pseudogymnoascus sp. VKM F-3808]|nr:hypothetical protein O988_04250 [Pseudogymnoascus sp. VKM F-3808]
MRGLAVVSLPSAIPSVFTLTNLNNPLDYRTARSYSAHASHAVTPLPLSTTTPVAPSKLPATHTRAATDQAHVVRRGEIMNVKPVRHCASRASTRSVSRLSAAQLARKRAHD